MPCSLPDDFEQLYTIHLWRTEVCYECVAVLRFHLLDDRLRSDCSVDFEIIFLFQEEADKIEAPDFIIDVQDSYHSFLRQNPPSFNRE